MKFWFDSDGKSASGRRFFARVEEVMVDKDGKPVYVPTPSTVVEPAPEEPVVEAAPVQEEAPAVQEDNSVAEILTEVLSKVDVIIDLLSNQKPAPIIIREVFTQPAPLVVESPVQEPAPVEEAPVEEAAPVEEVVEEVAAAEAEELGEEDPNVLFEEVSAVIEATEEAPVEEAPVEEVPAEVVALPVEGETVKAPAVRSRCFAEKMRDADEILQDRYDELKNYALRFRKLKSRISRKFDSINQGRFQFVKLSVAGKTLKLYLNMDINTTDPKFHCKDMSDKKTYVTVPTMLRIKSGRAVKYAKILIDQCAEQHGMLERRKPFIVDAMALIEESLASKQEVADEVENDVIEEVGAGDAE